ncbi:50S ribosomal protein L33 [Numidum massiliense]|nr:50S ribosomal protein L33 [Numidum massiliense]
MRVTVTLACTECGERNYTTTKNKRTHSGRIEFKKFCPRDNRHTLHRETK